VCGNKKRETEEADKDVDNRDKEERNNRRSIELLDKLA
jgi:hypothetical protein